MDLSVDKKLQSFQLIAQEKLQAIICSIPGKKHLIIEPSLIRPLEHVCAASWLKLKGIQRIYKYDTDAIIQRTHEDEVHIFMIRSSIASFQKVLQQIQANECQNPTDVDACVKNFHIICVPSCFAYFHALLEKEGLYGIVQLHRFNWDFIFLDQGVLSMEINHVFSNVFLRQDTAMLSAMAHSLRVLTLVCNCSNLIFSYGEHATQLAKTLQTLNGVGERSPKDKTKELTQGTQDFGAILIIDRDKDYVSSLLTPSIYAGLLQEVFTQNVGEIDLTSNSKIKQQELAIFATTSGGEPSSENSKEISKKRSVVNTIVMNSMSDEIYGENRYRHFTQASSSVRAQAKSLGLEIQKLNDMSIDEMHLYVARKLPKVTELKTKLLRHLNASEKVIALLGKHFRRQQMLEENILNNVCRKRTLVEIDELIATEVQKYNTLRLICLQHLCAGITVDELDKFARNYCNCFGHSVLGVFELLARGGLLPALKEQPVEGDKINKSAMLLLAQLPLSAKFQQTEFQANANRLKLLVNAEEDNESHDSVTEPNANDNHSGSDNSSEQSCPSYVFNRLYIPLVAQICQLLIKCHDAEDCVAKLGMLSNFHLHLETSTKTIKNYSQDVKDNTVKDVFPLRTPRIFVFVVGGITYAEIGACDLVSRLTNVQIVLASDSIISGTDLIASAFKLLTLQRAKLEMETYHLYRTVKIAIK